MAYPDINVRPVQHGNFVDGSVGRTWYTGSGPYRTGDIHVVPSDYKSALFTEIKVVGYPDEPFEIIIACSLDKLETTETMVKLLHDDSFAIGAITSVIKALDHVELNKSY